MRAWHVSNVSRYIAHIYLYRLFLAFLARSVVVIFHFRSSCSFPGISFTFLKRLIYVDPSESRPPTKATIIDKLSLIFTIESDRRAWYSLSYSAVFRDNMSCLSTQGVPQSHGTSKKGAEKETGSSAANLSLPDPLATALLKVLATVLQCFATASPEEKEVATLVQRMVDLIG